jgi:VRR-NUC domain
VEGVDWVEAVGARAIGERPFGGSMVAGIEFPLRQWDGPIGEWKDHIGKGKKQVYPLDGGEPLPSCAEVEVAKRLRLVRNRAFWFSPWEVPPRWQPWTSRLEDAPDWLASLDATMRAQIAAPKGGIPDVVAWNDVDPLRSAMFVECKGRREAFKDSQEDWVGAASRAGIQLAQFAVAVRPF